MIKWYPSPAFLAQMGHFLLGICAVMVPAALRPGNLVYALIGTVILAIYAVAKEIAFDPAVEAEPFWWGGFLDLFFLFAGPLVAWLLLSTI